jgi:hypothetical protein
MKTTTLDATPSRALQTIPVHISERCAACMRAALEVIAICTRANAAARCYEDLKPLCDHALGKKGIARTDLPRIAFEKLAGGR